MRRVMLGLALPLVCSAAASAADRPTTFTKDMAPIFQQKCERCHRAGGMAPMPLSTFEETQPWVRSIKHKVQTREMPPWHIDRRVGISKFKNDMPLTDSQIAAIVRWADAGAVKGDPADMPPPVKFPAPQAWGVSTPDLVIPIDKENVVSAEGYDQFAYHIVDTGLIEDRWVKAFQIKPGDASVVHHACVAVRPSADAPPGPAPLTAEEGGAWFGCYDPGFEEVILSDDGAGQLLKDDGAGQLLKKGAQLPLRAALSPEWEARARSHVDRLRLLSEGLGAEALGRQLVLREHARRSGHPRKHENECGGTRQHVRAGASRSRSADAFSAASQQGRVPHRRSKKRRRARSSPGS